MGVRGFARGCHCDLLVQGRHDPDPPSLLGGRHAPVRPAVRHMKTTPIGLALGLAFAASSGPAQTITFGDRQPGVLPKELEVGLTGGGPSPRWEVVADPSAKGGKALAQLSADPTDLRFPLAITRADAPADVEVTTRFKPIS